jgi:hypothetical protein
MVPADHDERHVHRWARLHRSRQRRRGPVPADLVSSVEITGSFQDCQAVPSSVTITFTDGSSVTAHR